MREFIIPTLIFWLGIGVGVSVGWYLVPVDTRTLPPASLEDSYQGNLPSLDRTWSHLRKRPLYDDVNDYPVDY